MKSMPGSLDQALDALEKDHDFLLRGDVFTKDVIETWLEYKRKAESMVRFVPIPGSSLCTSISNQPIY